MVLSRKYFSSASISSRLRTVIGRIRGGVGGAGAAGSGAGGKRGSNSDMENRLASIRVVHEHDDADEEQDVDASNVRPITPRVRSAMLSRLKLAFLLLLVYATLWFVLRFIRLSAAARMQRALLESGMDAILSSNPKAYSDTLH